MDLTGIPEFWIKLTRKNSIDTLLGTEFTTAGVRENVWFMYDEPSAFSGTALE
jgi:hypothetical protein